MGNICCKVLVSNLEVILHVGQCTCPYHVHTLIIALPSLAWSHPVPQERNGVWPRGTKPYTYLLFPKQFTFMKQMAMNSYPYRYSGFSDFCIFLCAAKVECD